LIFRGSPFPESSSNFLEIIGQIPDKIPGRGRITPGFFSWDVPSPFFWSAVRFSLFSSHRPLGISTGSALDG
jgi:hypothetical protein